MDTEAAEEAANLPGLAMMVIGALNALFWLVFSVKNGIGLLFSLTMSVAAVMAAMDGGDMMTVAILAWTLLINVGLECVNVIGIGAALVIIFGGMKLRGLTGKSVVMLGIAALVGTPILSIVLGALGAIASFDCCGLIFGQLPTVVLLVINAGVAGWAFMTVGNEDVAAAFASEDE